MRDIEEITIVLENCETFTFCSGDVSLLLDGLNKHIWGGVEYNSVDHALIEIKKEAECNSELGEDWRKRIHKDITQVWLKYDDDSEVGYHFDWDIENGEYENNYETDLDDRGAKVYIISRDRKKREDF